MQPKGRFLFGTVLVLCVLGSLAWAERSRSGSAWDEMIRDNPAIVDDTSVGWKDRLILSVLSREQAEAYYQGTRAEDLLLDDGQTLAEYLEARLNQPGNVYVPLPVGCELFSVDELMPGETRAVKVRGQCGIPEEATAVILQIRAELSGLRSRVKVWASDLPEPAEAVVDRSRGAVSAPEALTTVVNLCLDKDCGAGDLRLRSSEATRLRSEALGYFRPVNATDGVGMGGGILYYTEGDYNNFFGTGAGASNGVCDMGSTTQSCFNTFVGGYAGASNTTGFSNAFFGYSAGRVNTAGLQNAFFGAFSGYSNTTGNQNTFFGNNAGHENTTGNWNTFFGEGSGYSNTTASENAFFGTAAGLNNTTAGENAFFGHAAGYSNTTGYANAFFGNRAGFSNIGSDPSCPGGPCGSYNSFFGHSAGASNTTGKYNDFFGHNAGAANTTGSWNSFFGEGSGRFNTTGYSNAFFGQSAGHANTTGYNNAFFGGGAGYSNTTGEGNAIFGNFAGFFNTTGSDNAFFGSEAGVSNTTGYSNAFFGRDAGYSNTEGYANLFFGYAAGFSNTTGYANAFFGTAAGYSNIGSDESCPDAFCGSYNSFFGHMAGWRNTTGFDNAFFGAEAGTSNTTGVNNAFFGSAAGWRNTTGEGNAIFGAWAGSHNTTASENAFFGATAGSYNTTGYANAFFGYGAGSSNIGSDPSCPDEWCGSYNSFFGHIAGYSNTTGTDNAFFGERAGYSNTTGSENAFFGTQAGFSSDTGYWNAFFGTYAGHSNTVEYKNTFIGGFSDLDPGPDPATSPVTNATAVGYKAYVSQSNSLVLGSIAGVNYATASTQVGIGVTAPQRLLHIAGPNAVFRMDRSTNSAAFMMVRTDGSGNVMKNFVVGVDAFGSNDGEFAIRDLGTAVSGAGNRRMTIRNNGNVEFTGSVSATEFIPTSALRFKSNVETLEDPVAKVMQLRGVRFNWKATGEPAVGVIAEEVAKVLPEVVAVENGQAQGVNYDSLVAVLIETAKAQQEKITGQQGTIKGLQEEVSLLKAQMAEIQARLARQ